eukprot:g4990.t1
MLNFSLCSRSMHFEGSKDRVWHFACVALEGLRQRGARRRLVEHNGSTANVRPIVLATTFERTWKLEYAVRVAVKREIGGLGLSHLVRLSCGSPMRPSHLNEAMTAWSRIAAPNRSACYESIIAAEMILSGACLDGARIFERDISRPVGVLLTFTMWWRHLRLAAGTFSWLSQDHLQCGGLLAEVDTQLAIAAFIQCQRVGKGRFPMLSAAHVLCINMADYEALLAALLGVKASWSTNGVPYDRCSQTNHRVILRNAASMLRGMTPIEKRAWVEREL